MKLWWNVQAARLDALSTRERLILFVAVIALLLALLDVLWLTPAQNALRQAQQQVEAQNADLTRLRAELQANATPVDVNQTTRDALAGVQAQIIETDAQIASLAPASKGGPGLEQVLVQFLRRQDGITLQNAATLADATPAGLPQGLRRLGVEVTLSGSYPRLVGAVKALEAALPQLRWGAMRLTSDKTREPELNLQVFVLAVQQ